MATGTRDRLLAAAWTVIQRDGITAATSRRITEAAGTNLASITYHFGSKDALVGQAVVAQLREWTAPLTAALLDATDDVDSHDARIAAAVGAILARLTSRPHEIQRVVTLLITDPEIPGVRDAAATWLTELRSVATNLMVRQQAAGLVPEYVDPRVMAAVFTAFALGIGAQANLDPNAPPIPAVVAQFLSLLVRPAQAP